MAGLNFGVGGGAHVLTSAPTPPTVEAANYASSPTAGQGVQPWHLGVAVPVAAVIWLAFLRYSLPN